MKKSFKTIINKTDFETIIFSAGKIGYQVEVKIKDLDKLINYQFGDICG